jgi:hypothetical protein
VSSCVLLVFVLCVVGERVSLVLCHSCCSLSEVAEKAMNFFPFFAGDFLLRMLSGRVFLAGYVELVMEGSVV